MKGKKKGGKYPQMAKGANLAEGVSHMEKVGSTDGMYARNEKKQRPAKGSDRI